MGRLSSERLGFIIVGFMALLLSGSSSASDLALRKLLSPVPDVAVASSQDSISLRSFKILRAQAAASGRIRVIVGLRVPFAPEGALSTSEVREQRTEIDTSATTLFSRLRAHGMVNGQTLQKFSYIPFVSMQVTADELDFLRQQSSVLTIDLDRESAPLLAQSSPLVGAAQAWTSGYTGAGQTVAILDTGVDKSHPFLGGKVVSEACYSGGGLTSESLCPGSATSSTATGSGINCPMSFSDDCSHGTHVAGIVAGTNGSISGVAKGADLIAIQVFSASNGATTAYTSDIIRGLERVYALRNSYSIAAVNMSLGGGSFASACDLQNYSAKVAIDNLRSAGIATIIASGNDFSANSISFPACISSAISVGATWDLQGSSLCGPAPLSSIDRVACFSNSASMLNFLAPGILISSSVPGSSFEDKAGTSMAAPQVAGAWAVIKQKIPTAAVSEVVDVLSSTGVSVTDYRNGIVKPRIDLIAALDSISSIFAINFTKTGTGAGTVTFTPPGTLSDCAANCSNSYAADTVVTLMATPAVDSTFAGWTGSCTGTGTCSLAMSAPRSVTATFNTTPLYAINFTKAGKGSGSVTFSPPGTQPDCAANCSNSYASDTVVTLMATPAAGSTFAGWAGNCTGTGTCRLAMSAAKSVTATFNRASIYALKYTKTGRGRGAVTFLPSGTKSSCSASCSNSYASGTVVMLTAIAEAGSTFAGWSNGCAGNGTCLLAMSAAKSVRATFNKVLPSSYWRAKNSASCADNTGFYFGTQINGLTSSAFSTSTTAYQPTTAGKFTPFYTVSASSCTQSQSFSGKPITMKAGIYYTFSLSYSSGKWNVYVSNGPAPSIALGRMERNIVLPVAKSENLTAQPQP